MAKNLLIAILIIIILGLVIVGLVILRGDEDTWLCNESGQWVKHGHPSSAMPTAPCGKNAQTTEPKANLANPASTYCAENGGTLEMKSEPAGEYGICVFPDGSKCEEWSYFRNECQPGINVTVFQPSKEAEVSLPIKITGNARVFENTVNIRLKDSTGQLLYSGIAMASSSDTGQFGEFETQINYLYRQPQTNDVILEVYWASPKDGSDLDLVSLPLKLALPEVMTLKAFFSNNKLDPQISCNKVFSVTRIIPKTEGVGKAALELLLAGLSPDEISGSYGSSINQGTELKSLAIENGTAKADFNDVLGSQVAGSCRVSAIRSQITETLKQFPNIKNVIISINGQSEDILQP